MKKLRRTEGNNTRRGEGFGYYTLGEKGGLPYYRETIFVILVCVRDDSLTVEGRVSKQ